MNWNWIALQLELEPEKRKKMAGSYAEGNAVGIDPDIGPYGQVYAEGVALGVARRAQVLPRVHGLAAWIKHTPRGLPSA